MTSAQWERAGLMAAEMADHYNRVALVRAVLEGQQDGLSLDALVERVGAMLAGARKDRAEDVAHYRRQLLATTTRAPVQ